MKFNLLFEKLTKKKLIDKDAFDYLVHTLDKKEIAITELEEKLADSIVIGDLTHSQALVDLFDNMKASYEARIAELEKQLKQEVELDERMQDWLIKTLPVYNAYLNNLNNLTDQQLATQHENYLASQYEELGCQQEHEL